MSKSRKPTVDPVLSAHMAKIGRSGGRASTAAKAAAAGRNAGKPYRNGEVRGWPPGKPRAKCLCGAKDWQHPTVQKTRPVYLTAPPRTQLLKTWVCGSCREPAPVRKSHARKAR